MQGRKISKQNAEEHEWQYSYDPMGNLLAVLNPRGYTTQIEYTPTYRVHKVVDPEQHALTLLYNPNGKLTDKIDRRGVVTHNEYNELDRLVQRISNFKDGAADHETNVKTAFEYDLAGNLRFLINPRGFKAELRYDAANRRTEVIDFEQGSTRLVYDKVDNVLRLTDANDNPTEYQYDDLDQLVAVINAENETKWFEYDVVGNRTAMIEADATVTAYDYDAIYRLNGVIQNFKADVPNANDVNVATQYGYDARGLLTSILNANENITLFEYDKVGQVIREIDPLNKVWEYAYDGVGNKVSRKDAKENPTSYSYLPDDQLHQIGYFDETVVQYTYDPNNNRTSMQDGLGETTWTYDPLNRRIAQDDPFSRVLQTVYDAASNRVGLGYADGNEVDYAYSPNNWLATVTDPHGQITAYERDKVGNITHTTNPNAMVTDKTYDRVYRVLTLANRQVEGAKKTHSAFDYQYNLVGHVTQVVKEYGWQQPPVITETYTYDGVHRLATTTISPLKNNGDDVVMAYVYDAVGNRLAWDSNDDLTTHEPFDGFRKDYEYNVDNQLLKLVMDSDKPNGDLLLSFLYDDNGNRINKLKEGEHGVDHFSTDYSFDPENRLLVAQNYQIEAGDKRTDRDVSWLDYDGGGRRLAKHYDPKLNQPKGGGVDKQIQYVFDGLDPVAEYNMLNGQRTDFYRGAANRLLTMHSYKGGTQGNMYWYHHNFKGDVSGLTKHNGNSHHNYRYDPYGGVVPENGNFTDPHNHYTLTGKEYDENMGLVWFGARHYDPEVGVWVSQDSYRGSLDEPMSLHRFGYVEDNPVNMIDLYGYYGENVHYSATYFIALAVGFSQLDAQTIANADQGVDTNKETSPITTNSRTLNRYHFPASSTTDKVVRNSPVARKYLNEAIRKGALTEIGKELHVYQDSWSHEGFSAESWNKKFAGAGIGSIATAGAAALCSGPAVPIVIFGGAVITAVSSHTASLGHASSSVLGYDPDDTTLQEYYSRDMEMFEATYNMLAWAAVRKGIIPEPSGPVVKIDGKIPFESIKTLLEDVRNDYGKEISTPVQATMKPAPIQCNCTPLMCGILFINRGGCARTCTPKSSFPSSEEINACRAMNL